MRSRIIKAATYALAANWTVGCTAVKSPEVDERVFDTVRDVPAEYVAGSSGGEVDTGWVSRFKDKTLSKLVVEVEQNNPDLKIAAARVQKAAANVFLAGADARPMLDARFGAERRKQNFIGFPFSGSGDGGAEGGAGTGGAGEESGQQMGGVNSSFFNTFGPSLDARWEVDLWGRVRAGQTALMAEMEGELANVRALHGSLAGQTAKVYFALMEAGEQVRIARETRDSFAKTVKSFVDSALERGEQPVFQARLAKTDEATAEATVREREQVRDAAARQLEILLGRYPKGEIEASGGLPEAGPKPPTGIPASLLRRRPDIIAAERRVAAADSRIREAKLALLPQISLTSSLGTSSEDLKNVLDPDFSVYSFAFNALQPILNGGKIKGNVKIREAEVKESLANFERTALGAFREVEDALDAEGHLSRRSSSVAEAKALAKEAYDRALDDYADGNVDALTLLTAQRQWLNLQAQEVSLKGLRLSNRVDLHMALGGDYRKR